MTLIECSIYAIHNVSDLKLLAHLRSNLSHLMEPKSQYKFKDKTNPMCICALEPETTSYYLLCCKLYSNLILDFLKNVCAMNLSFERF